MLKPCPFCGSEEVHVVSYMPSKSHDVTCGKCETKGPVSKDRDEAIKAWNKRVKEVVTGRFPAKENI